MSQGLPNVDERARKMVAKVLQALQEPGRAVAIASSLGVAESTISRLKNDHLSTLCQVLVHAGLKIVPVEFKTFAPEKIAALLTLAKAHLASIESADEMSEERR